MNYRSRKDFGRIPIIIDILDLIEIQKKSYERFLQKDVPPERRDNIGLQADFLSVFPVYDFNETATLEFVEYSLRESRYDVSDCLQNGVTYSVPIKIKVRLVLWEKEESGAKTVRDIKEQEVYLGELPLMTDNGTFIINGVERVVVSQLHRSPGCYFHHDEGKTSATGKIIYSARVIPHRGSWLDFEFDMKDMLHVRIDRRRKIPATIILKALGYSNEQILRLFYPIEEISIKNNAFYRKVSEVLVGSKTFSNIVDKRSDEVLLREGGKITKAILKKMESLKITEIPISKEELIGRVTLKVITDKKTGDTILKGNEKITDDALERILKANLDTIELLFIDGVHYVPSLRETLLAEKVNTPDEAVIEIYRKLRPGKPPTPERARDLFENLFFNTKRYDLSTVGRWKLNKRLGLNIPLDKTTLTAEDIIETMKYLFNLKAGKGEVDDIDHLGNRRVRSIGELLENQIRIGLVRMERAIREKMNLIDLNTALPHDLINARPVTAAIKEFFGSSQLSQFMDQTNPLAEITHKRRLSALGPGGLTRERAGFEVRDVHPTHYGRICPVETPEGPNIGLITSLATYARVNEIGLIESPYRKVKNGRVTDEIEYLSAISEEQVVIAQANSPVDARGRFKSESISARVGGDFRIVTPDQVDYMDVSPKQIVSVSAALIPFLENDDANRALMGSNMQRQAVPVIQAEAPIVGTGMERIAARDSGVVVTAKRNGVVERVDATRIVVKVEGDGGSGIDIYNLIKSSRSNQNTCINQKPIVSVGESVKKGQILADGSSTDQGELALGKNVLVAFMPWGGYNFEDAILISERLVKEDTFTSIHIEAFEIDARDTKLGKEEITRDIPNVSEEALKDLDESGIIRIGANVKPGDILVGKVTPKGETQLTPEEKLLRAIFGEKARDVKEASLYVPPGIEGTVVDVRVLSRKGEEKDERAKAIENEDILRLKRDFEEEVKGIKDRRSKALREMLLGKKVIKDVKDSGTGNVLISKGKIITQKHLDGMADKDLLKISLADAVVQERLDDIVNEMEDQLHCLETLYDEKEDRLRRGDELPPGVIKLVRVYIAMKRNIQVGDKMAGRHGNKGVVSRILPEEDMPYLPDGTPVDIVLNPLGVPSRMNVGQVLETHLGWAAKALGLYVASPVFDGATEKQIKDMLKEAKLPISGQIRLYDGRTGESFDHPVTVGYMYMMKLHHLVEDKIHARSIGPYSLVTQQPLGGKAQFGGQRLGEMEVWALQAYGAAHILQEFLTVKSDDVAGRARIYEAIVKGENILEPGMPESFHVLIKELQSLCFDVELLEDKEKTTEKERSLGDIYRFFEKPKDPTEFEAIRIKIASPEKIREWSHGEVKKPETINYRSFKPERDGLFCAKIFGPTKDWECNCGKYKRMKHRGIVCDKCGVEVIQSKVRRERLGHIELVASVAHVWFLRSMPSRIGLILDMSLRQLESILYFENHVVIDPGNTPLREKELLSEERYRRLLSEYGDGFKAGIGAEALKELLKRVNLDELSEELYKKLKETSSLATKKKITKRLRLVEAFRKSGNRPEWMILDVIPVLPPELRPLVPLEGGRFATSDLNDLYRRVINRNNRLKRLEELNAPTIIIRNEKRMLQEAVDALFDNSRRGRALKGQNKRPLKSLSDMLRGKQGRFRQNLLGKRVDYSGRSVIVVGPELKLHQCGIPKKMALELFKPFIFNRLEERGYATTIKAAKKMVDKEKPEVWDVLEEVIKEHPVLLNRAPTLHRLGIQAFDPVLVEGRAIKIHPLVCTAFNADFDGDQMAVHVPLSVEARLEARVLMMSVNNILSPANGRPIAVPTQEMVLGCYYLTKERKGAKGEGKVFYGLEEVRSAYDGKAVEEGAKIKVMINGDMVDTTVGRVIFGEILPSSIPFSAVNKVMNKKELMSLTELAFKEVGPRDTVFLLDKIEKIGFEYATKSGASISIDDMHIPSKKVELIKEAEHEGLEVHQQYADGLITNGERYNKIIDIWAQLTEKVADEMMKELGGDNPIFMMADSGARGSVAQIRQLAGMRGLMAKPSGEIIETPITANFREGLTVLQYFISTHGARKGLADTALKTANAGYLTRRLVDVAQHVIVTEEDCGTLEGIHVSSLVEGGEIIEPLEERIIGRVTAEDIIDPLTKEVIVKKDTLINEDLTRRIIEAGIDTVKIRSVLTCQSRRGVCVRCYGSDLATGRVVEIGEAIGIIAAQSIGEPGTQLTMRTFHIGGAASKAVEQTVLEAKNAGKIRYINLNTVRNKEGDRIVMNRNGFIAIYDKEGREKEKYSVLYGAKLKVEDNQKVEPGQRLMEWDPYSTPILTEIGGKAALGDIIEGLTVREEVDEITGLSRKVIIDYPANMRPRISIKDEHHRTAKIPGTNNPARYLLPAGAHILVERGDIVSPGDVLAKIPRETTKTKDITGGLPRVAELFEARKPKEQAVISEIDGIVEYGGFVKGMRRVIIRSSLGDEREYLISKGKHVNVHEGDWVRAGEPLMDGSVNPHDILDILGPKELQKYLVDEVQRVYRLQGVSTNDKHIEVIVRQMLKKVKIEDPGDTTFLVGEQVDKFLFASENERVMASGGRAAIGKPILLGITRASLTTDSFISAASFQETTRVLTEAAVTGAVDELRGLKENVIMGRLIPAGTGVQRYRNTFVKTPSIEPEETPLVEKAAS